MLAEYEEQARPADESGDESAEEEFQSYAAAGQLSDRSPRVRGGGVVTDEPTVVTTRRRTAVARAFGLKGEGWMRHANPASVWSRFAVLPLLALAIWSRDWIGWWSLAAVGLALVWMVVNPLFFREPASTRNWASRGVLGERIWTEGDRATFPPEFRSKVPAVAMAFQVAALVPLVYGLVELDVLSVVVGIVLMQCAKAWYIDRMVLLFETMKDKDPDYARWDR